MSRKKATAACRCSSSSPAPSATTETIHNVRSGTLELSCVGIANIVPFVKKLGILTLPYLFSDLDEVVKATNGAPEVLSHE